MALSLIWFHSTSGDLGHEALFLGRSKLAPPLFVFLRLLFVRDNYRQLSIKNSIEGKIRS